MRVAVLVDLAYGPQAGGHVRYWENCARAGAGDAAAAGLDLTVYFNGEADETITLSDAVRLQLLKPRFSTARLPFLSHVPDHTDLARRHPALAARLDDADVIHTTDGYFAYARTGVREARRRGVPLVNSVHTDTPRYARLYTGETVRRLFGRVPGGLLLRAFRIDRIAERRMERRLVRYQEHCAVVFGPREEDRARARAVLPADRVLPLPRGLDLARFAPEHRDRAWLAQRFHIDPAATVIAYAGRVDVGKNIRLLAEAVRALASRGVPLHLVCAGKGQLRETIEALLPGRSTCPGALPQEEVGRLFASADIVAHPSIIESFANAVIEGMAAGRPVLVSAGSAPAALVADGETGLVVPAGAGAGVEAWTAALAGLAADPERRERMGRAARAKVEAEYGDWRDVLFERFLPVWCRAAREGGA